MSVAAVLFDMDGVLIDSHQSVTAFWDALAKQYNVMLTDAIYAQHIYGTPVTHTLTHVFPHLTAQERQAVIDDLARHEANVAYTEVKGVGALIRALKQHGIPTAVVTSAFSEKVGIALGQLGLNGLFDARVTVEDVKVGKPDPQCYLLAAQRLNTPPDRCLVFEDAVPGVKAARAAGMLCIGIQSERGASTLLQLGARHVIHDFSHIRLESVPSGNGSGDPAFQLRLNSGTILPIGK